MHDWAQAPYGTKAQVDAKQIPKWQYEFTGSFLPVVDVGAMPAVHYSKFLRPLGVNKLNTSLVLDGFAATAEIRRREREGTERLPVVALTANVVKGFRDQCLDAGMDYYLSKPFDQSQLAATLEKFLGPPAPEEG